MARRRRFNAVIKRQSAFALNINSMTDMFILLLVFLLQTYSTASVQIEPQHKLRLPTSSTQLSPVEGVRVIITEEALKLDDRTLATLDGRRFAAKDVDAKDPNFLPVLFQALDKMTKDEATAEKPKDHVKEGRVLLQADAGLPYETLRKVLYTASMAGYPQLKLVTMVGN